MFFEPAHAQLGQELAERVREGDRGLSSPLHAGARLAELGLFELLVPPKLGGRGMSNPGAVDVRALCLARERLAYVSPVADAVFAVQGLGSYPVVMTPTAPRRGDFLHEVMCGERIGGFALTEPEAGSDVASLRARAVRDGEGWLLDGDKVFISNVGIAHHFIVFAHAEGIGAVSRSTMPSAKKEAEKPKRTISAFLVDARSPGLTLEPMHTIGDHPVGRLTMRGCRIPKDALLDEVGNGLRLALGTLDVFRTSVGAAAVGMARRAIDESLDRVAVREQFGRRLSEFQLTQAALADMATELDAARLLVYRAAWLKDHGENAAAQVAMAKLYATEAAQRIIDRAVQLHGGLGVMKGSVVEMLYREIRPLRIYEGTSEIQKLIIGAGLVKEREASV
jgi:acyl-CoA dehydrogenase